jgi:RNA polymerase sigma factor (sigma-70 family)
MPTPHATLLLRHIRKLAAPPDDAVSDRELLHRFAQRRDEDAFAMLLRRHGAMVLRTCRRQLLTDADAEDAFQTTFLTLARKAGTVRWHDSAAGWLHSVACNAARKARDAEVRRSRHERAVPVQASVDPLTEMSARELLTALDEELSRLPAKYREPLMLCYLEGMTRDEAAQRLGCPLGTLKGRLERGKELLRTALERRGLSLSAALAAALVGRETAAAVPPLLARITLQAACLVTPAVSFCTKKLAVACLVSISLAALGVSWAIAPTPTEPADESATLIAENRPAKVDAYGDPLPDGAIRRLGTLRFRQGGGSVNRLLLTRDGKTLISKCYYGEGAVAVWDFPSGKFLRRFPGHYEENQAIALTPDDKMLAIGHNAVIHFYDLATGREVRRLESSLGDTESLAFSPASQLLASGHGGQNVLLWDIASGKELARLPARHNRSTLLAFSPDGKTLATGDTLDRTIRLFDVASRRERQQLTQPSFVRSFAFSPDGARLAAGGEDGTIPVWDVATGRLVGGVRSPHKPMGARGIAWSPDGKTLAASEYDDKRYVASIRLWDVATGKEQRRIEGQRGLIESLTFTADGKTLISGGQDSVIRLWETATGKELPPAGGLRTSVSWLALSPNGKMLAYPDKDIRLRDLDPEREVGTLPGYPGEADFSADGVTLAGHDGRSAFMLWDVADRRQVCKLEWGVKPSGNRGVRYRRVAFSPDGKILASAGSDYRPNARFVDSVIHLWDPVSGKVVRRLALNDSVNEYCTAEAVMFSPDGQMLAASGRAEPKAGKVRLWDTATGKERSQIGLAINNSLGELEGPQFPQSAIIEPRVVFSPDGRLLAMNIGMKYIPVWEAVTGRERCRLEGHEGPTARVAFAPDGRTLASAGYDQTIRLWDLETGKELQKLTGHRGKANALAFTPDGQTLISGGDDTTIMFWDVKVIAKRQRIETRLEPQEWHQLWTDLAGSDAASAHKAMARLTAAPSTAVALKDRLHPATKLEANRLEQLLRNLDSDDFAVRDKATREIETLGEAVRPAIAQALTRTNLSPELRRRLEQLRGRLAVPSGDPLRALRAVEVLEHIGSPEARQLLEKLASGAPEARLTREAKASLERLGMRSKQ